jgi:Ca2+-binding RTX toxin-like protein
VTYQATGGTFAGGVTLKTGGGNDTVSIRDTLPAVVTTVNTGGGNDSILVSSKDVAGNLAGIKGALSIDAGTGQNVLTLADAGAATGNAHVVINGTQVMGFAGPSDNVVVAYKATGGMFAGITLEGSNSLALQELFEVSNPAGPVTIKANAGNDTVRLLGLNQAATIDTGAGNDQVYVGYLFNNLDAIQGPVQVLAGTGADVVYVQDQSAPAGHAYGLSANTLIRNGAGSVGFNGDLEHLYVSGTNHANQFSVQGVPTLTNVHLGGGNTTDLLTGPNAPNTFQITQTNGGVLNGKVGFVGIENLTGGTGNDRFAFADGQKVSGGVAGMGGTDTLDYSAYTTAVTVDLQTNMATGVGVFGGIERVHGGAGSDLLTGTGNVNLWQITGVNSGKMTNAFLGVEFASVENLRGGSAADTFALAPAGRLTGTLDGRLGSDTLDYSAWGKGVAVNLSSGTATVVGAVANVENATGGSGYDTLVGNAGNNILRGGGGIDSLKGSLGDDILIGDSGDDLLQGGDGRDILIGGIGVDKLHGGAGDDILIGGYTTHDANDTALLGLMAEWKTANSYQLRRDHLMFGGGLNGVYLLTPATVIDDGVKDGLYGEADTDWFWGQSDATDKSIVNNVPEVVNQ